MDDKILKLLRDREGGYVSGEEISRELGVSRAGVWKHIEKLRKDGYDIAATPHLGYQLVGAPDNLIGSEIGWKLDTHIFGKKIYSFKKADSTNDIAYKIAQNGAPEGTVVFAQEQAAGRGRFHRAWSSPPGGIYMSLILRPQLDPIETARITLMASVAVAEAIRIVTGLPARIKWPNDVIINGLKVSGILTEMKAEQDVVDFVILGIGVNVNTPEKDLPDIATSLKAESGEDIPKTTLAKRILEALEKYYLKIREDFGIIIGEWRGFSDTLGARVRVQVHGKTLEGQALDVDENGALILRLDSGFIHHIFSGDVELVR